MIVKNRRIEFPCSESIKNSTKVFVLSLKRTNFDIHRVTPTKVIKLLNYYLL